MVTRELDTWNLEDTSAAPTTAFDILRLATKRHHCADLFTCQASVCLRCPHCPSCPDIPKLGPQAQLWSRRLRDCVVTSSQRLESKLCPCDVSKSGHKVGALKSNVVVALMGSLGCSVRLPNQRQECLQELLARPEGPLAAPAGALEQLAEKLEDCPGGSRQGRHWALQPDVEDRHRGSRSTSRASLQVLQSQHLGCAWMLSCATSSDSSEALVLHHLQLHSGHWHWPQEARAVASPMPLHLAESRQKLELEAALSEALASCTCASLVQLGISAPASSCHGLEISEIAALDWGSHGSELQQCQSQSGFDSCYREPLHLAMRAAAH